MTKKTQAAAIMMALATMVAPTPAAATPPDTAGVDCGSGHFCLYPDYNYSGNPWVWNAGMTVDHVGPANDQASSLINNTTYVVRVFENSWPFRGHWGCIPPGHRVADLRAYQMNDRITRFESSRDPCQP